MQKDIRTQGHIIVHVPMVLVCTACLYSLVITLSLALFRLWHRHNTESSRGGDDPATAANKNECSADGTWFSGTTRATLQQFGSQLKTKEPTHAATSKIL